MRCTVKLRSISHLLVTRLVSSLLDPLPSFCWVGSLVFAVNFIHMLTVELSQPWPIVERFLKELPSGSVGLDVGCGNGKYLAVNPHIFIVASDRYVTLSFFKLFNLNEYILKYISRSYLCAFFISSSLFKTFLGILFSPPTSLDRKNLWTSPKSTIHTPP